MVSEETGEEEVAVLLVIGYIQLKRSELHATLARHTLRGRLLLREHSLQLEFTKLHIGSQTEEAAGTLDKRRVAREGNITRLNQFDDFILLAIILQLHVLRIIVEGGIGVVIQVEIHLVANLTVQIQINLLIEVHHRGLSVADRQRRVVDILLVDTKLQFGRTLRLHPDAARTEDFLSRSQVEVHIGEIEFLLALSLVYLVVLLPVESVSLVQFSPCEIFRRSEHDRSREPGVAHLVADDVSVDGIVVDHIILQGIRALQVERTLVEVAQRERLGALNLPAWMQQGIWDGIFRNEKRLGIDARLLIPILCGIVAIAGLIPDLIPILCRWSRSRSSLSVLCSLVSLPGSIILQKRQSEGVAEGRNHQPRHRQIYDSLSYLHLLNLFQCEFHHLLHRQVGLSLQDIHHYLCRRCRREAEHGKGTDSLILDVVVHHRHIAAVGR